jgi:hypothetical protein
MKRVIGVILLIGSLCIFAGCDKPTDKSITKMNGDLVTSFLYDSSGSCVISKSVFNSKTDTTIEYTYYYDKNGFGDKIIGVTIITIDKDGKIIDRVFNQLGDETVVEEEDGE